MTDEVSLCPEFLVRLLNPFVPLDALYVAFRAVSSIRTFSSFGIHTHRSTWESFASWAVFVDPSLGPIRGNVLNAVDHGRSWEPVS